MKSEKRRFPFSWRNAVSRRRDSLFRKRAAAYIALFLVAVTVFCTGRIGWIMVFHGEEYRDKAARQQLHDRVIEPIRGTIYDVNMMPLATSGSAWVLIIDPNYIHSYFNENFPRQKEQYIEHLASGVSEILGIDKAELIATINEYEVEEGKEDIEENRTRPGYKVVRDEVNGVERLKLEDFFKTGYKFHYEYTKKVLFWEKNVDDDFTVTSSKFFDYENDNVRVYTKDNFAASVIGVVNNDGDGVSGIEKYYNDGLKGTPGRVLTAQNAWGEAMETTYETYYDSTAGLGHVLTIDYEIQGYLENALDNAMENIDCDSVYGIVMDVDTGAVLGMSDKPDFDMNNPFVIDSSVVDTTELKQYEKGTAEYSQKYNALLQESWDCFCVSSLTDPGSIFKIFTGSALLEEGVANANTTYNCTGSVSVLGQVYSCNEHKSHGNQSFTRALMNSCNCFFITNAVKLGMESFYKYYEAFGFMEKTGIDIPNEAAPLNHKESERTLVNLASTSFGQSIGVSPIQVITATCAIANGGKLMQPYILDSIVDENGNLISKTEPTVKRQVISEETAATMRTMMEAVVGVEGGTGSKAYLEGYRVAGKTATSEKLPIGSGEKVAAFVCFAPADDPEVAVLVGVVNPKGSQSYGSTIAAPIAKKVLEPTLEHLGVERVYTESELKNVSITTPDFVGEDKSSAKILAVSRGLNVKEVGEGDTVVSQIPAAGQAIPKDGVVIIYTDRNAETLKTTVPDFTGKTISAVNSIAASNNLNVVISSPSTDSEMVAYSQSVLAGEEVKAGSSITVYFKAATGDN